MSLDMIKFIYFRYIENINYKDYDNILKQMPLEYKSIQAEIFIQKRNDHKISQLTSFSTNYYVFHRIKD
jgi:hypothetical protein